MNICFRYIEYQIWNLWVFFLVQRTRSMLLAFILLPGEGLFMEQRYDFVCGQMIITLIKNILQLIICKFWLQEGKLRVLQCDGALRYCPK